MMADAAHAKPHHDYHLVNPSPWPAVGSVSAFVSAVGAILWMHHITPAIERAVAAEREECLAVVESHGANNAKVRCIADDIRKRAAEASSESAAGIASV